MLWGRVFWDLNPKLCPLQMPSRPLDLRPRYSVTWYLGGCLFVFVCAGQFVVQLGFVLVIVGVIWVCSRFRPLPDAAVCGDRYPCPFDSVHAIMYTCTHGGQAAEP